ncbi:MAG: Rieske 2Fe-2S domain-containing protein [Chloroflexi bacterium]|nr:Rieske 2Fe-2S domain-containing protein [Chloroflexota bacterium]
MLTAEENTFLTQTTAGTPMGALWRQYWLPAMLSRELPNPDCDPVRVLLLGEKLIAFRDTNGQVGLIQNHCPHRGASLFFGRNEEAGLRCVYHGWKFDVSGQCIDMPNEPAESNFKNKVKATAYPCRERNGIVWTYMGPRSTPPELPMLEANMIESYQVSALQRECNWLQGLEGDFDTSHASFLHRQSTRQMMAARPGTWGYYMYRDMAPKYQVVDTPGGAMYTGYRDAEPGYLYHRIAQYMFPGVSMTPVGVLGVAVRVKIWVPMDDTHSLAFYMQPGEVREGQLPNTSDWYGRFKLRANASNDYELSREKQRNDEQFSGITGTFLQDQAITESEGPIYDRTTEHLGTSDVMVIHLRKRIMDAGRALAEHGITPPGVDAPDVYSPKAGGVVLPKDVDWVAGTEELRKGFVAHPEIDTNVGAFNRA